jgi:hypothetical protein
MRSEELVVFTPASSSTNTIQLDYFSLPVHFDAAHSDETPLWSPYLPVETPCDPEHPLLALRSPQLSDCHNHPVMETSKLMQHQTAAAYRPQAQPVQNPRHLALESTSSDSTESSTSSDTDSITMESAVRCCRCHRSLSAGVDATKSGFVSFGTNLYYCSRCASLVGYNR